VDGHGKVAGFRELAERMQARHLEVVWRRSLLLEVEADLANCHNPRIAGQLVERIYVGWRRLGGMMTDAGPNLVVTSRERDRRPAAGSVHPHRHHARDARLNRRGHNFRGVAQLLEVEVGVYEDATSPRPRRRGA
jgi:hypothetical protein